MSQARKPTTKRDNEKLPAAVSADDKALIAAMIQYGTAIGSALTIYKLEPGGDCDRSGPIAARAFRRAHVCLWRAAQMPAQTMEGLSAKARAVPFIFQDEDGGVLSEIHEAFILSFAGDAQRLAEQVIAAERATAHAAKGGAK